MTIGEDSDAEVVSLVSLLLILVRLNTFIDFSWVVVDPLFEFCLVAAFLLVLTTE